jgi:hypothetical protein
VDGGGREGAKVWAARAGALGASAPWDLARPLAQDLPGMLWRWGAEQPSEAWAFSVRAGFDPQTMGEMLAAGFGYWAWCAGSTGAIPFFSLVEKVSSLGAADQWKAQSAFDLPRRWPMEEPFEGIRGFAQDALGQAYVRMDWSLPGEGRAEGIDTVGWAWERWRPDPDDFAGVDWGKLAAAAWSAMEPRELASQAAPGNPDARRRARL